MRLRRWIGAAAVISPALALITIRSLDAPLFLYPSSISLLAGIYLRAFDMPSHGKIVAFAALDAAQCYQLDQGTQLPEGHLLIKPLIVGLGDHVCNNLSNGLWVNGQRIAPTAFRDTTGRQLPVWKD
jgi:type IV secretory pathway protease TraF